MVNQSGICYLIVLTLNLATISATELLPWFGNQLEFEGRATLLYQNYLHLNSDGRQIRRTDNDLFFTLGLSNAPYPEVSFEIESTLAHTRHMSNCLDNIRLTGRYLWLDDVAGDPISLATGLTFTNAFTGSLKDVSSFHHGRTEAELHVAVGKEICNRIVWLSRWWAIGAIGIAEMGSPWGRAEAAYEFRLAEHHEIRSFINTLWGWGNRRLHEHHFHGYGAVAHRSVDLGLRYTYLIPYFGNTNLEYSYRVFARNFPDCCQRVTAQVFYLF